MDIGRHLTRLQHQMVFNLINICVLFVGVSGYYRNCTRNADSSSQISIRCPLVTDRIRVSSMLYAQLTSQPKPCYWYDTDEDNVTCLHWIYGRTSPHLYTQCTGLRHSCTAVIGPPPPGSDCTSFNYFAMEYYCIPERDMVDLCGDGETVTLFRSTNLAYFPSAGDRPSQDCTCVIQGRHKLLAFYAGVPQTNNNNCFSASLTINWTSPGTPDPHHTLAVKPGAPLAYKYVHLIVYGLNISRIHYTRNCSTLRPPVWFLVSAASVDPIKITCRSSAARTTSSTVSTGTTTVVLQPQRRTTTQPGDNTPESTTQPGDNTPESTTQPGDNTPESTTQPGDNTPESTTQSTEKTDIAVIAGSVTGGLLLIVVVILVCVLYRFYRAIKGGQTARPPLSASPHMAPPGTDPGTDPACDVSLQEETIYAEISDDPATQQHQGTPRPRQQTTLSPTAASSQDGKTVGRVEGITDALTDSVYNRKILDTDNDYLTPRSKAPPNISKTRADNQKSKPRQQPHPPPSTAPSQEYQNVGRVGDLADIVYYNVETFDKEKVYLPLNQSESGLGGGSYAALNVGKAKTDNR